jgi:hypothetical protein
MIPTLGADPAIPTAQKLPLVRGYEWIANQSLLACALVLVLTLGIRAALLPWMPIPAPRIHDEFSYLLASDTYAHGRLANPPHPFWQHFETFQVLQQPTYAAKYQPLQGMVLAFGQKFLGEPWAGVYLSTGVMCAVLCWMLQGWIAPNWALLGSLLFLLRVGVMSYWMNSYEGGSVPAIGGALALGALARIWRRNEFGHTITWAVGISVIVLSRPYDAAVLGIVTGGVLTWRLFKTGASFRTAWAPALTVLALCGGAVAYNDYRVTGNPLTLPYQVQDAQYAMAPMFMILPLRPEPAYRHAVMRQFWAVWNVNQWKDAREGPFSLFVTKAFIFLDFFFGFWPLTIPLLLWPYALRTAEERATVILLGVFVLMIAPLIGVLPHYGAAFAGVIYLRFLQALSRLRHWTLRGKPVGIVLAGSLVALFGLAFGYSTFEFVHQGGDTLAYFSGRDTMSQAFAQKSSHFGNERDSVKQALRRVPGRHVVLVRYAADHDPQEEWVFNAANIDAAPVVWAREMTPGQDHPMIQYFHDRRAWLLEPDQSPPRLTPYAEAPDREVTP